MSVSRVGNVIFWSRKVGLTSGYNYEKRRSVAIITTLVYKSWLLVCLLSFNLGLLSISSNPLKNPTTNSACEDFFNKLGSVGLVPVIPLPHLCSASGLLSFGAYCQARRLVLFTGGNILQPVYT